MQLNRFFSGIFSVILRLMRLILWGREWACFVFEGIWQMFCWFDFDFEMEFVTMKCSYFIKIFASKVCSVKEMQKNFASFVCSEKRRRKILHQKLAQWKYSHEKLYQLCLNNFPTIFLINSFNAWKIIL